MSKVWQFANLQLKWLWRQLLNRCKNIQHWVKKKKSHLFNTIQYFFYLIAYSFPINFILSFYVINDVVFVLVAPEKPQRPFKINFGLNIRWKLSSLYYIIFFQKSFFSFYSNLRFLKNNLTWQPQQTTLLQRIEIILIYLYWIIKYSSYLFNSQEVPFLTYTTTSLWCHITFLWI